MAEALLRKHGGDRFEVVSGGLDPTEVHPLTRQVLFEVGIDASELSAKGAKEFLGKVAIRHAIIVCAQAEKRCPRVFPFTLDVLYGRSMIRSALRAARSSSSRSSGGCATR
jgi:arsenate reductase